MNTDLTNPPQVGVCGYCGRPSVRLLNAPLFRIPTHGTRPYENRDEGKEDWEQIVLGEGKTLEEALADADRQADVVWFKTCVAPANLYDVLERDDDYLIVVDGETCPDRLYCFRCFDGHVSPSEREYCINMPRELKFTPGHPWWAATWVSAGREIPRHHSKVVNP